MKTPPGVKVHGFNLMGFIRILLLSCFIPWCDNDELTSYDILEWCRNDVKDVPIDFGDPLVSQDTIQIQMASNYPDGIDCSLSVIPRPKHGIRVNFLWLDLPGNTSCQDYIQINTISSAGLPLCRFQSLPARGEFFFSKAIDITVVTTCQVNCYKLRNNFGFIVKLKSDTGARPTIIDDDVEDWSSTSTLKLSPSFSQAAEPDSTQPVPPVWLPRPTLTPRPPVTNSVALYSTLILVGILVAFAAICVVVGYCKSHDEREIEARRRQEDGGDSAMRVTSFANPVCRARNVLRPNPPRIIVTSPDHGSRPRSTSPLRRVLERHSRFSGSRQGLMSRDHPPPYTARVTPTPDSEDSNSESEIRNPNPHDNPRPTVRFDASSNSNLNGNAGSTNARRDSNVNNVTNPRPTRTTVEINIPQPSSRNSSPTVSPPCYTCVQNQSPVCFHQTSMPAGAVGPSGDPEVPRSTRVRIKSV